MLMWINSISYIDFFNYILYIRVVWSTVTIMFSCFHLTFSRERINRFQKKPLDSLFP